MGVNKKIKKNKEKNNQCVMHKIKIINEKNKKNKKIIQIQCYVDEKKLIESGRDIKIQDVIQKLKGKKIKKICKKK